jgi:membrane protein implicated in regulation of membrane protease activity
MLELFIWGALFVILILVESATAQLVSIWFAAGSLAAMLVSVFTDSLWIQLLVFIGVSFLLLLATRPFIQKLRLRHDATNADSAVGQEGITIVQINNLMEEGRIKLQGLSWNARSENNEVIPVGAKVKVVRIEGVTAYVTPLETL